MQVRVFRGAIQPPLLMGVPFVFGVTFVLGMVLILIYILSLLGDKGVSFVVAVLIWATVGLSTWLVARDMTKRDPYGLRQTALSVRFIGARIRGGQWRLYPVGRGFTRVKRVSAFRGRKSNA